MPTTSDDNLEDPCRHTPGASWLVALERTCRPPSSINSSQQPIRSADERDNEEIINLFLSTYTWDRGTDRVHDMCRTHRSAGGRRADDNSHRGERGDGDCDRWWGSTDDGQCLGHCGPVGPFTLLRCKMFVAAQSGALVRPYTRCRTERTDEIEFSTRSHIAALPPAASAAGLLIAGTLTAIAQIKWKQAAELCELAGSPRPPEWPNVLSIPPEWNMHGNRGTRVHVSRARISRRGSNSHCASAVASSTRLWSPWCAPSDVRRQHGIFVVRQRSSRWIWLTAATAAVEFTPTLHVGRKMGRSTVIRWAAGARLAWLSIALCRASHLLVWSLSPAAPIPAGAMTFHVTAVTSAIPTQQRLAASLSAAAAATENFLSPPPRCQLYRR